MKVIDLKGNPFDDGAKVSTIRRFGEDTKISSTDDANSSPLVAPVGPGGMRKRRESGPACSPRSCDGLIKVNLTDFISGKYSLSYERVRTGPPPNSR